MERESGRRMGYEKEKKGKRAGRASGGGREREGDLVRVNCVLNELLY